jgi:hypothetical protein
LIRASVWVVTRPPLLHIGLVGHGEALRGV